MKTDTSQVMNVDCLFYHTIDYIADDWRQQKALAINYKKSVPQARTKRKTTNLHFSKPIFELCSYE